MTIDDLKNLANDYLQAAENAEPERLRERVMAAHTRSVTRKLLPILAKKEPDDVLAGLENLLKDNWQDTQRTMLCYTAMPECDITRLFIKTAEFVAQSRNERPRDEPALSVIELLMPGIATESLHDSYPDLHTGDVQTLLNRHVLGVGSYLIPVKLLADLNADERIQLHNVYFDYEKHEPSQATLNEAELERLYQHSPETRALKEAYDTYRTRVEDKSTLLDNLMDLCAKLHLNSSNMQGTEDNAGGGAYPAIFAFNEYYATLAEAEKTHIPQNVSGEIKKLLDLSSDKEQNKNATDNLETCIATRRSDMLKAIKGQEATLGNIAVSDEHKKKLASTAKQHFEQCQHELKTSIDKGRYRGNDSFGLTRELLDRLKIQFSVSSLADLHDFLSSTAEEITEIGQSKALKKQMAAQVKTLEDWIILATETPLPKLEALMMLIGERLANTFIKKPVDVLALLMTLTPERADVVCGAMNNKLPGTINKGWDFAEVLQPLTIAQRSSVFRVMRDKLPGIIKSSEDFGPAFEYLTIAQRTSIYQAMKDKLPDMIQDSWDFGRVLEYLNPEQRASVYNKMEATLPDMIHNSTDLGRALQYLSPEQRTSFCNALQDKLPKIIQNDEDFSRALEYLITPEQCTIVCAALKEQLPDILQKGKGLGRTLQPLTIAQCTVVCSAVKAQLPEIIQSGWNFGQTFNVLSSEQLSSVCNTLKDQLPAIIQNGKGLGQALHPLNSEQCESVCTALQDKLPDIIKNGKELGRALQHLTIDLRESVVSAMNDKLPDIIKNGTEFAKVLKELTPWQRTSVCNTIKDKLPDIIQNGKAFGRVLQYLNFEQRDTVYGAMHDKLPDIIIDSEDLAQVLKVLSPEQCTSIYTVIEDKLPDIIKDGYELKLFLASTNAETQQSFLASGCANQLLAKIITNFKTDISECHQQLKSDVVKNEFNQALFSGLLQDLEAYIQKMPDHDKQRDAEDELRLLKGASDNYFNAYPHNRDQLKPFQQQCSAHIKNIKSNLRDTQGLATILGKILLAVVSLGLIPLGSAIKNKYQTGDFQCRFFAAPGDGDLKANKVSSLSSNLPIPG